MHKPSNINEFNHLLNLSNEMLPRLVMILSLILSGMLVVGCVASGNDDTGSGEVCDIPLIENDHYQLLVRNSGGGWREVNVHDALCSDASRHPEIWNDWNNDKALRDTMSYAIFEAPSGVPVEVRVKKLTGSFSKAEVRPGPYGIVPENIGDNTIEFTLPSIDKGKVSVEFDGDRQHNLFLFGYEPDENRPDPEDQQVIYYGPGEHDLGDKDLILYDNQTLYIDYGAKVYGKLRIHGDNVTVAGHGILSGERLRHWGEYGYACGDILIDTAPDKKGLRVKDITIIDSPSWTFRILRYNDVVIDGINMISWILNGDGIDLLSSHDVEIKNCFLRTYDDAITLKVRQIPGSVPDLYDVRVHDCIIYSDFARGIVIGPEAGNLEAGTGYIHDVTVEDCFFLNHGSVNDSDDIRAAFAIGQYARYIYKDGSATAIRNVTARNLVFDSIGKSGMNVSVVQDSGQTTPCVMENILFENFTIYDRNKVASPAFYVRNNQNSIKGMTVRNCIFDGKKIMGEGDEFEVHGTGELDIKFE